MERGFRRHLGLLLALAVLAPLYLVLTCTSELGDLSGDATAYMIMARHYSGSHTAASAVDLSSIFSRFPPLYPIVLARLHVAMNLLQAHALSTGLVLAGFVALYELLCAQGLLSAEAALLTLLFAMLPGSWLQAMSLQSEALFLPLSYCGLLCITLYMKQDKPQYLYGAALAIGAAILTRSIGLALLPPMALPILLGRWRPTLLSMFAAVIPVALWNLLHRAGISYGNSLFTQYGSDPWHTLLLQIGTNLTALRDGFADNLTVGGTPRPGIDFLATLVLVATLYRSARLKPDAVYIVVYLVIVTIWPFAQADARRYLWPVLSLLIAQPVILLARAAEGRLAHRQAMLGALSALLLLGSLPAIALASQRFRWADTSGVPGARSIRYWYYTQDLSQAYRRTAEEALIVGMLKDLGQEVPRGQCVIAVRSDLITYFADRLSTPPPTEQTQPPDFERALNQWGCRYVFMTSGTYPEYPTPLYPLSRLSHASVIDYRELPKANPDDPPWSCMLVRLD